MSEEFEVEESLEDFDEIKEATKAIKRVSKKKLIKDQTDEEWVQSSSTWDNVVSIGSTQLNLAISGGVVRGGGLPGGFVLEIFGPEASGKTTIGCELISSVQKQGGECKILDPENRLTPEYCKRMGVKYNEEDYYNPETVEDVFDFLIGPLVEKSGKTKRDFDSAWSPDPLKINVCLIDSIAALAGRMELNQGDAMGGNRPRQFSQGLRLAKGAFRKANSILFLTNQLRDNMSALGYGKKTYAAGGRAIKFYSSVRIELSNVVKLKKTEKVRGREHEKVYGICVDATVIKNSLDDPWRTAKIYLLFDYGIDDIRANLQWLKDNGGFDIEEEGSTKKGNKYIVGGNGYTALNDAVKAVEDNNLEEDIRNQVIDLWEEIHNSFKTNRKPKQR